MKTDGVKKNFLFQFAYQCIVLVIPLVLSPYLTRTLGENALGIYTYSNSIAYYFVIFCGLGISKHGQRVIASRRNDEIELRRTFWSLFMVHTIVSFVGLIAYFVFCILFVKDTHAVYYAQGLYVLSSLFDVTWLFYGIEKFRLVVIRNAIVKVVELILIFSFVRNEQDIVIYTVIMTGALLVSQISMFPTVFRWVKPIKFSAVEMKEHIRPLLVLSISVIAISLYTVFDKTLLGILTTAENVAYYEYSNKIIMIPKTFIGIIGTVLFPRTCNCIANNDMVGARRYYKYSLLVTYFMGIGAGFGLIAVSDLFVLIYYGTSFAVCGGVIKLMTPLIMIMGLGDIFRMQFLIPMHKDFQYTTCIIMNAIVNIALSIALIPIIGIYGAVVGTLGAELFGVIFQGFLVRKYIDIKQTIVYAIPFIMAAICMLGVVALVQVKYNATVWHLLFQILVSGLTYLVVLIIWFLILDKDRNQYQSLIVSQIRKRLK